MGLWLFRLVSVSLVFRKWWMGADEGNFGRDAHECVAQVGEFEEYVYFGDE